MKKLTHYKTCSLQAETFRTNGSIPDTLKLFEDILNTGSSLRVQVTGRSMSPFLKGGEILTIKKVPSASLHRGDLILFKNLQNAPVIHRIIKKSNTHKYNSVFQTKGDALFRNDEPVAWNEILGKVCKIEASSFFPWLKHKNMESFIWRNINFSLAYLNLIKTDFRITVSRLLKKFSKKFIFVSRY